MKKQAQHKLFGQGLTTLGLVLSISAVPISAQAVNWNCVNNFWDISSCWDTLVVPTNIDDVYVYTVGGAGTLLKIDGVTGTASANFLYINAATGTTVTLQQTGGALSTSYEIIGNAGTGAFTQTNGSNTITNYLSLGNSSTGNGSYNLSGTGTLSTSDQYIGNSGTGVFTQSAGGNALTNTLILGNLSAGNGSYDLSGTGTVSASNESIGSSGTGIFTQTGGSNTVASSLFLGGSYTGNGSYDLSGNGALSASIEYIGHAGKGVFTQTGGSNTVTNTLILGNLSAGNGSYNLSGTGTVSASSENIGNYGTGVFTQTGGSNTVASSLYLGGNTTGNGSYDLSGTGILSANNEFIGHVGTGVFTQTGGSNTVMNNLILGNLSIGTGSYGNGSYDLSGTGILSANNEFIGYDGAGSFTQSDGINSVTDTLYLGNNSSGSYNLSGAGILSATNEVIGRAGKGSFTQSGGTNTVAGNLTLGTYSTGNSYDLSGAGALSANSETIGDSGTGTFTQSGGTNTVAGNLIFGNSSTGSGSYNLSGSGTISVSNENIGIFGIGVFTQTGGSNTVTNNLSVGTKSTGNGTYTLSGGALDAGNIYLGGDSTTAGGTGVLNVNTGGSVDIANQLKLWAGGTVNLTGGTINTGSLQSEGSFNFNAGTLNIATDLLIDPTGSLAGNLSLTGFKTLGVGGTTALNGFSTLSLDGGTFSTGSLVNNGGFAFNSGTFNLTNDNLVIGAGGLFGGLAQFNYGQTVNVTNVTTVNPGSILAINNSNFSSGTTNNNGQINLNGLVASLGGGTINNAGTLTGTGQVSASLSNMAGGEVRVNTGDSLRFTGNGNINNNRISMLGGSVDFNQGLTNSDTGLITGYGTLVTGSTAANGLDNQGNMAFSGTTDIIGDVSNTGAGTIIVSGGATATFYDDVVHNGAEIRVGQGSQAVFFGAVSGAGAYTGSGTVFFEGDLAPGNSPSLVTVAGDMTLGLLSTTTMELGGLLQGDEYDAFDIGGTLSLGGELDVVLFDLGSGLFTPSLGDSFDLFSADTITGNFDLLTLAALGGNLDWKLDYLVDEIGTIDIARLSIVSSVPVPPSVWLFGSGLLGLIGIARRRKVCE